MAQPPQPVSGAVFESGRLTRRQMLIAGSAAGGYFTDGYDLLLIGGALLGIVPALQLNALQIGLLTASAFAGMALGSAIAGPLTDRLGRRPVFLADMMLFIVSAALVLAVQSGWQLIALRFVTGIAIGADMPSSASIITEFSPKLRRGTLNSLGNVCWMFGALLGAVVTLAIFGTAGPDAWRWVLATGVIPAAVLLAVRHKMPETPHWLLARGDREGAREAWLAGQGHHSSAPQRARAPRAAKPIAARYSALLRGRTLKLLLFISLFWGLHNFYGSAALLYQAVIVKSVIGSGNSLTLLWTIVITIIDIAAGIFVGIWLVERTGRRFVAIAGNTGVTACLILVGLLLDLPYPALIFFAGVQVFVNGFSALAYFAWAPELFPTMLRGRAVGTSNMTGKIGSLLGTLLFPIVFASLHGAAFFILGALALANAILAYRLGPETAGTSLDEGSHSTDAGTGQDRSKTGSNSDGAGTRHLQDD